MSKRVPIVFTDEEHKALKLAAVQADSTMMAFIKVAVAEKIARNAKVETAPAPKALDAKSAEHSAAGALAEASEKPA